MNGFSSDSGSLLLEEFPISIRLAWVSVVGYLYSTGSYIRRKSLLSQLMIVYNFNNFPPLPGLVIVYALKIIRIRTEGNKPLYSGFYEIVFMHNLILVLHTFGLYIYLHTTLLCKTGNQIQLGWCWSEEWLWKWRGKSWEKMPRKRTFKKIFWCYCLVCFALRLREMEMP